MRITLGGGGTDLPSYADKYGSSVLSAAINKYVYVTVNESFRNRITLKYSKIEDVQTPDEIEHPVIKAALKFLKIDGSVDIDSISDIPAGTGLGSSGSFTTALLQALHLFKRETITKCQLAEQAFHIEHDILNQHCGRQDQYIAAVGGLTILRFGLDDIGYRPLDISRETLANLEEGLMLFFTGYSRLATGILSEQDIRLQQDDARITENLHQIKDLGRATQIALTHGDLNEFSNLMLHHWDLKRVRSTGTTNDEIDRLYELGLANGALSGKLVGAGGGGFLLFYTEDRQRLRSSMLKAGLREVRIRFDFEGTSIVAHI
jgi:D-glycero-alpha-D-manno-heptose-7-phosphate kinase